MADEIRKLRRRIQELKQKRGDTEPGPFVASEHSKCFHRPDCEWVRSMSPENLIQYETHEEAVKAGYRPCKTCRS